jgi:Ca-activated chloride channel family protein
MIIAEGAGRAGTVAVLVALLLGAVAPAPALGQGGKLSALPEEWRRWLREEVYPLISTEQEKAFLQLETDEQRRAFADRLWQVWGAQSGFGSAFRSLYQERLQECRAEFGSTTEDRARMLLLHGTPDQRKKIDCEQVFNPLEFWYYARIEGLGQDIVVLFYRPFGLGPFRFWDPSETRAVLYSTAGQMLLRQGAASAFDRPDLRCGEGDELARLLAVAEYWMRDHTARARFAHLPASESLGSEAAAARFLQFSTLVAPDATPLSFAVTTVVGPRRGGKFSVELNVKLPRGSLGTALVGDVQVIQLDVVGEITRDGVMADRFRYAFTLPSAVEEIPLLITRELRPGRYRLRLKVADANSTQAGVQESELAVELPPGVASEGGPAPATAAELARAEEAVTRSLSLTGPEGEGVVGVQRFSALTGPEVTRVEFYLDGESILTKTKPPFEVSLDLGPLPRLATVLAVAFDAAGREVDRAEVALNVGRERFFVRLQPLGEADRRPGTIRASVVVNTPSDRELDRVELYHNEQLMATLYQPPFEAWLPFRDSGGVGYLRALAVLADGEQAEDLQFINAPQFLSGIDVEAVELPVTVVDRRGKPVEGLTQADFEVLEDGAAQEISHFSLQRDLPVRLGLVLDTSGSMEKTMPELQRVVLSFLRNLLRPRDRAFVLAFADRPTLIEGFTADFQALERALIGLRADRETALYDALVYGLFQFSGVRGRKAMILVSDGKDNASRMDFERAMDYAARAGATIYCIGIDLSIMDVKTRSQLSRLAQATGGQAFFLPRDADLSSVTTQIDRELRTQYLLAYTSNSSAPRDRFRRVTVRVKRPDLEVRTVAGYFPRQ